MEAAGPDVAVIVGAVASRLIVTLFVLVPPALVAVQQVNNETGVVQARYESKLGFQASGRIVAIGAVRPDFAAERRIDARGVHIHRLQRQRVFARNASGDVRHVDHAVDVAVEADE